MRQEKIELSGVEDEQARRRSATNHPAMTAELGDEDLAMVSGGCRKAGGEELEPELTVYKPIIAI